MATFQIDHRTTYSYNNEVYESRNIIKMYPFKSKFLKINDHSITVTGNPIIKAGKDIFGNRFGIFTRFYRHNFMTITSSMEVETVYRDVLKEATSGNQTWHDVHLLGMDSSFRLFLNLEQCWVMRSIWEVVNSFPTGKMTPLETVLEFNKYVFQNFTYNPTATLVDTPLDVVWAIKAGVCQDFSHVLIYMLRSVNIPARYVSGYICPNNNGMRGDGASHAWVEAYLPNYGWIGIDPTNNCVANDKHVKVAIGRDYQDVAPLVGKFKGFAHQSLHVVVTVGYQE